MRAASLVPFRLLEPHPAFEGGAIGDPEAARDNPLIPIDNLEALKALLPYFAGRVKCIYIDPPYMVSAQCPFLRKEPSSTPRGCGRMESLPKNRQAVTP